MPIVSIGDCSDTTAGQQTRWVPTTQRPNRPIRNIRSRLESLCRFATQQRYRLARCYASRHIPSGQSANEVEFVCAAIFTIGDIVTQTPIAIQFMGEALAISGRRRNSVMWNVIMNTPRDNLNLGQICINATLLPSTCSQQLCWCSA